MSECVKVMVRVRPMSTRQKEMNCQSIVSTDGNQVFVTKDGQDKTFAYDAVFGQNSSQAEIYQLSAFGLVQSVVQGYNGTIFAYGQTGCGKTFTMMGGGEANQQRGIIPRSFQQLVEIIQANAGQNKKFLVRVSFIEIYNEEVHDLLSKDIKQKKEVKENPGQGFYVKDLTRLVVKGVKDMQNMLALGFKNRAVGQTLMNKQSSRSHSIFTLLIETQQQDRFTCGKLNFVDLAGSQKQSKTKAEGDRFKQAVKINLSLSTLGNVISSLVDGKTHIPYRVSKLTKLLQDSLGGNTKTVMFANISPASYNQDQTLSTLHYASRAKFIQNKPKINEDPKDALLREYAQEIKRLKGMLENGGGGGEQSGLIQFQPNASGSNNNASKAHQLQQKLRVKDDEYQRQRQQRQQIQRKLQALMGQVMECQQQDGGQQARAKYHQMRSQVEQHNLQRQKLVEQKRIKQKELTTLKSNYKSIKEQNQACKRVIRQLQRKVSQVQRQIDERQKRTDDQKCDLLEHIMQRQRDQALFDQLVSIMLTSKQVDIIRSDSEWLEDSKEYKLPPFYFKDKKLVFPFKGDIYQGPRYQASLNLVDNQKSKMELIFQSEASSASISATTYRQAPAYQAPAQPRSRKQKYQYKIVDNRQNDKIKPSKNLSLAPLQPLPLKR